MLNRNNPYELLRLWLNKNQLPEVNKNLNAMLTIGNWQTSVTVLYFDDTGVIFRCSNKLPDTFDAIISFFWYDAAKLCYMRKRCEGYSNPHPIQFEPAKRGFIARIFRQVFYRHSISGAYKMTPEYFSFTEYYKLIPYTYEYTLTTNAKGEPLWVKTKK